MSGGSFKHPELLAARVREGLHEHEAEYGLDEGALDALNGLLEQLESLRTALDVAGRHLEDCCRTDIDLGEQMDTHNAAVDAVHRAERVSSPASEPSS